MSEKKKLSKKTPKSKKFNNKRFKWQLFSIFSDLILINLGFILAFVIRFLGKPPSFNFQAYTSLAIYISAVFIGIYYIHDLYNIERHFDISGTFIRVIQATFLSIVVTVALSFFIRAFPFPRSVFILSFFIVSVLVTSWRYFVTVTFPLELPEEYVAVLGEGQFASRIAKEIESRGYLGLKFAGFITTDGEPDKKENTIGSLSELESVLDRVELDRLIIAEPIENRELVEKLLSREGFDIHVQVVPEIYETCIGKVDFDTLADIPLIEIATRPDTGWAKFGKRLFDIFLSSFFLILFSPILLISSILIKLSSKGPVFYRQKRLGYKGKEFKCVKFRTMVENAEEATGPVLARRNDNRITGVGRLLRKYRIDELPQLWNILKGEMSFVGPRPERTIFVEKYIKEIPAYYERFKVRPGATGLAQIYGRYQTDASTKLKYDLIYIYNLSFFLDMLILFKTVTVVLTGKGAR